MTDLDCYGNVILRQAQDDKTDISFFSCYNLRLNAKLVRLFSLDRLPVHCRDPKDDKLLALALGGGADYLVSGDKDLLVLNSHPKLSTLKIVTAKDFLQKLL